MRHIQKCAVCGAYTMGKAHCGKETRVAHPPKYSPEDKYASYRRKAAEEERGKEESA